MNNQLIPRNMLWYKIKRFFKNIFCKEKEYNSKNMKSYENSNINNTLAFEVDLKNKFEEENKKRVLAEKLLLGELGTSELNDNEVDEMTEYFTKDIQDIDNELLRIKQHILAMQKQLKNKNM